MEDRCDRCGVAGKAYFIKGDLDLVFCGHHTHKYEFSLTENGWEGTVINESAPVLVGV